MKTSKFFKQVVRVVQFFSQHEWTSTKAKWCITGMIQKVKLLKDRDIVKLYL